MQKKILIIDDDQSIRIYLRTLLKNEGCEILEAVNGEEGLKVVQEKIPDIILLDIQMPGMSGVTVCRILRENPRNDTTYIIMLTASTTKEVESLNTGADDYITKPVKDTEAFLARIQTGLRQAELRSNILTDELGITRLPFFRNSLDTEVYRSKRYRHSLSIVFLALDNFDQVQAKGNEVEKKILAEVVELINLRKSDSAAQQNAGEFILLLPVISASAAAQTADRLRQHIAEHEFTNGFRLTASFSVVSMDHSENLLEAAGNYLLDVDGDCVLVNGKPLKKVEDQ